MPLYDDVPGPEVIDVPRLAPIDGLVQPIAHSIVAVGVRVRSLGERLEPVGLVIGVCTKAISEQVAAGMLCLTVIYYEALRP